MDPLSDGHIRNETLVPHWYPNHLQHVHRTAQIIATKLEIPVRAGELLTVAAYSKANTDLGEQSPPIRLGGDRGESRVLSVAVTELDEEDDTITRSDAMFLESVFDAGGRRDVAVVDGAGATKAELFGAANASHDGIFGQSDVVIMHSCPENLAAKVAEVIELARVTNSAGGIGDTTVIVLGSVPVEIMTAASHAFGKQVSGIRHPILDDERDAGVLREVRGSEIGEWIGSLRDEMPDSVSAENVWTALERAEEEVVRYGEPFEPREYYSVVAGIERTARVYAGLSGREAILPEDVELAAIMHGVGNNSFLQEIDIELGDNELIHPASGRQEPKTGEFDADKIGQSTTHSKRDRIRGIKDIVRVYAGEYEDCMGVPKDEIIAIAAEEMDIDESKAEHEIERLSESGELYRPDGKSYATS